MTAVPKAGKDAEEECIPKGRTRSKGQSFRESHLGQVQNSPGLIGLPHRAIPQPWGCPAGTERTFGLKVAEGNSGTGMS